MRSQRTVALGKVGLYVLLPFLFALIPTARIESGPTLCVYRLATGRPCLACGLTRAMSCVVHGQYGRAWRFNKRIVLVAPLVAFVWLRGLANAWRRFIASPSDS